MLIRFVKKWRMYQPGEIAGFEPDMAQPIIASGFAVLSGGDDAVQDAPEVEAVSTDKPAKGKAAKSAAETLPAQGIAAPAPASDGVGADADAALPVQGADA